MEELIKDFKDTGNCIIDIDKVISAWNDKFCISQWHEEYRLIEYIELYKEDAYKVGISKEQAMEIIEKLKLLPIRSSLFRYATTWRSKNNIISEKIRIENLLKNKTDFQEIKVLRDVISEFNEALSNEK